MSAFKSNEAVQAATIAETAAGRDELSVLAAVVRAAELVDTLASPGPFTLFAPTDAAFSKLPEGEVNRLLRPENKVRLASLVTSHILAGQLTLAELRERVSANGGRHSVRTVDGHDLQIEQRADALFVVDASGTATEVAGRDLIQSNGVIHMTDSVLSAPPC